MVPSLSSFPNWCLIYSTGGQIKATTKQLHLSKAGVLICVHAAGLNPVDAKQVIGDKIPNALQVPYALRLTSLSWVRVIKLWAKVLVMLSTFSQDTSPMR